jgi:hypothetical protein
MATAVVVATVVTTDLSEASCKDRLLAQIRRNDSDLRAQLSDEDTNANVVTAILNIEEFMDYVREWSQRKGRANGTNARQEIAETTVITDGMDEFEFMEHALQQLRQNGTNHFVALDDGMLAAMEEETPGEDLSRFPFRY